MGLYRAVVAKGAYRTGDLAVYIPEQAVLPGELVAELGLTGKLAGSAANRVKAIRLRGELSQGIVCRPTALAGVDLAKARADGSDFAAELGIVKWVPPVPVSMSGDVEAAPELLPWIDIENLKRCPAAFMDGEPVAGHGEGARTVLCVTYHAESGRLQVTSKGLGAQRLALMETRRTCTGGRCAATTSRGWRRSSPVSWGRRGSGCNGEVYGAGVPRTSATARTAGVGAGLRGVRRRRGGRRAAAVAGPRGADRDAGRPAPVGADAVPRPLRGGAVMELAEGRETLSGRAAHIREGGGRPPAPGPLQRGAGRPGGGQGGRRRLSDAQGRRTEYE
ncbi:RNA ligase (ATP) [Streptomyces endophytica]|uniref:RNA ligase (ATP) n=1 Tax=Streptomyces endophytica TaxID=2991496 RepID=A0ABY6PE65_9ACTN|nr:RNA ligase (ATP) [Streptomyces endophytica]UZJ31862.1 RNA ligase (ATP) [Streptomyces endophytica]